MILILYVALAVYCFCVYMWHYKDNLPWLNSLGLSLMPAVIAGAIAILPTMGIGELLVDHTERTFSMDESSEGWITYGESTDGYGDPAIWYYQSQENGQLKDYYVKEEDADVHMTTGIPKLVRQCKDYSTVHEFFHIPFMEDIDCSGAKSTFYIPYPKEN